MVEYLGKKLRGVNSIPRDDLLTHFDYPKGLGTDFHENHELYNFLSSVLADSKANSFVLQIESIPAHRKIFNSADDLPIADKPLIVVFKDKDIISAEYCSKHEAWHTAKGDINIQQIHQWAYTDDFYHQLNLPEFPSRPKRLDSSELIKGLKGLFEALSDAAVEVQVHKVNSKGNSLKDIFEEVFGEKSDIFKSSSKH